MSNFPHKTFQGVTYQFGHLDPVQMKVALNVAGTNLIDMHVTFGCHCFTEEFDKSKHTPGHSYTYKGEHRAFDVERYTCSLQLPQVMQSLLKGTIYHAKESYTYVAHITLPVPLAQGPQSYSLFFSLEKDMTAAAPALRMFVKSAYLKPLVTAQDAQNWRFPSLAGQIAGVFPPKQKKPKPTKKKKTKEKSKA